MTSFASSTSSKTNAAGQAGSTHRSVFPPLACVYIPEQKNPASIQALLRRFSPEIEPSTERKGLYWLNTRGLSTLFGRPELWAKALAKTLSNEGLKASIALGFSRFGVYAIALCSKGTCILSSSKKESQALEKVPLGHLPLAKPARDQLSKLGAVSAGDLLRLPESSLIKRFGPEMAGLLRQARGSLFEPLRPLPPPDPIEQRWELDAPESCALRLCSCIQQRLTGPLLQLKERQQRLACLQLRLFQEDHDPLVVRIKPAEPTLDEALLLELLRLRLDRLLLASGVVQLWLEVEGEDVAPENTGLFTAKPKRDPKAAAQALARVRAEFGEHSVVVAVLKDEHLPERRFAWRPLVQPGSPAKPPANKEPTALVRTIFSRPVPLQERQRAQLLQSDGPHSLSGAWWQAPFEREYFFLHTQSGAILWVFVERSTERWWVQGQVL